MSQQPINRSPDLSRLRDEFYAIRIVGGHLEVQNIPYVNSRKEVKRGALYAPLTLQGDRAGKPGTHVVRFAGEHPCNKDGSKITQLQHGSKREELGDGIIVDHSFSNKPKEGFADYYDLVQSYVRIISSPAESLDPSASAKTTHVITDDDDECVFRYVDTNSSRGGIGSISDKLKFQKIAIVGLGGTGSYVLDGIAKTPVSEIHLFDGDTFLSHNAFRSPGAATIDQLRTSPFKAEYFSGIYSNMHSRIVPHCERIYTENLHYLNSFDFAFLCVDDGDSRRLISRHLVTSGIAFVDVGMGLRSEDGHIGGILRATMVTETKSEHFQVRAPLESNDDAAYATNIQISELNMMNAALAILAWKKHLGFYEDRTSPHHFTYTIGPSLLLSEDNGIQK